jgi:energy-coupling factor transport system ATP-binding protein
VIVFEAVTVAYAGVPVLRDASFAVPEGELVLVVGPTGSGKTSLLRCLDGGLGDPSSGPRTDGRRGVSGGERSGSVLVDGVHLRDRGSDERTALVGMVRQDPASGMVGSTVESVISAGVRPRADDAHSGRRQVEETLDLLGLAELRDRPVTQLSGGQQQRVAIGAALVAGPRVLVLDEPTSALDPVAAEEVLAILHRLVHDVGVTVVVAEHRLERVVHHADSVLLVDEGRVTGPHDPAVAMARSSIRPPVVELGLRLGWTPLPLSVRDARRRARSLRAALAEAPAVGPVALDGARPAGARPEAARPEGARSEGARSEGTAAVDTGTGVGGSVEAHRLSVVRRRVVALRSVTTRIDAGEVVALMGRNGSGKSTLLASLEGALEPTSGRAIVTGRVALAPQDPTILLTGSCLEDQLTRNDEAFALTAGASSEVLERLAPGLARGRGTAELSEGQKVCAALGLVLARPAEVLLLDEPTRGLDYGAKSRLAALLTELGAAGRAIILATHDVELAAEVATRVVILAEGEVVADGPAERILCDSPAFAPQVAKVLHPLPYLRVADVVTDAADR